MKAWGPGVLPLLAISQLACTHRVQLPAPIPDAPLAKRQEAYRRLAPKDGIPELVQTTREGMLLGNGEKLYDPRDLGAALLAETPTRKALDRANTLQWVGLGGIALETLGLGMEVVSIRTNAFGTGTPREAMIWGSVSTAMVGIGVACLALGYQQSAYKEALQAYPESLQTSLRLSQDEVPAPPQKLTSK